MIVRPVRVIIRKYSLHAAIHFALQPLQRVLQLLCVGQNAAVRKDLGKALQWKKRPHRFAPRLRIVNGKLAAANRQGA